MYRWIIEYYCDNRLVAFIRFILLFTNYSRTRKFIAIKRIKRLCRHTCVSANVWCIRNADVTRSRQQSREFYNNIKISLWMMRGLKYFLDSVHIISRAFCGRFHRSQSNFMISIRIMRHIIYTRACHWSERMQPR